MTAAAATLHRPRDAWSVGRKARPLLAAALAFAVAASLPAAGRLEIDSPAPFAADSLAELPVTAQAAVSRALGRDDPAYWATPGPGGVLAENARHGIAARFGSAGVDVEAGGEHIRLALRGWGYGDALRPVAGAVPTASANRVEYRRGPLTEWYVNGPLGLQQGFTLASPPAASRSGPLTASLTVAGTLEPILESDDALRFRFSSLRYQGLVAFDAAGRELPARLELQDSTLLLRVEDTGARYPITIDPFVQQAKLTASDGAEFDQAGWSVAISEDTVVVGAPFDDPDPLVQVGSAYVFVKPATGWANMTEVAKLTASDPQNGSFFGYSVGISDDTVVVGAPGLDSSSRIDAGAAYAFVKPAAGWANMTETAKLSDKDLFATQMGIAVAVSGDTIVVGQPGFELGRGCVLVFVRPASGWTSGTASARLVASDMTNGDQLGTEVAVSEGTVVAGAFGDDIGPNPDQGSAYVFVKPAAGWTSSFETAKLTASDGAAGDSLGWLRGVAVSGDTILAGAPFDDVGSHTDQGSAYVFTRPATGWASMTETAKLTASDGDELDRFGAVAVAGEAAIVGARFDDIGSEVDQGSAYVFARPATGWTTMTETEKLTVADGARSAGFAVAASERTVVVGAPAATVGMTQVAGAAYVFGPVQLYSFQGFLATAMNPPALNQAKTANVQKLYFRLGGDRGLDVLAPGSPQSRPIDCMTKQPLGPLESTETPAWDSLTYQAHLDRYYYPWKPRRDAGWAGTCRELVLTLADGSEHRAWFYFPS